MERPLGAIFTQLSVIRGTCQNKVQKFLQQSDGKELIAPKIRFTLSMMWTHIAKDVLRPVISLNGPVMCCPRISHKTTSFHSEESLGRCLSGSSILQPAQQPTCACLPKQFLSFPSHKMGGLFYGRPYIRGYFGQVGIESKHTLEITMGASYS